MPPASTDSRPVRVELLGGVRVFADERELESLAAQRTRCALLVLLAIERDIAKERVVSILWPDAAPEKARHTLNQTLSRMRTALGPDWVENRGERICIADSVTTDVAAFEAAVTSGDLSRIVDLYTGPFFGAHNPGAGPAFDLWVDARRARLSRTFHDALRRWVEDRTAAGEDPEALPAVRRAVDADPTDDEAQYLLIRLLARSSVRDALDAYDRYMGALALIEAEPAEEIERLVAELREGPRPLPDVDLAAPRRRRRQALDIPAPVSRWPRILLGGALAVAAIVFVFRWNADRPGVVSIGPVPIQIFVDEFRDQSAPRTLEPQAETLTQHVINALVDVSGITVTGRGEVFSVGALGTGADSVDAILRADFVIGGFLERFGDRAEITVHVFDPATQSRLDWKRFEASVEPQSRERMRLAEDIAAFVRQTVGPVVHARAIPPDRDPAVGPLLAEAERRAVVSQQLFGDGAFAAATEHLAAADSVLILAAKLAPGDPEPILARARVAELRALAERFALVPTRPAEAAERFRLHMTNARAAAQEILDRDRTNVDALEARGRANRWLVSTAAQDARTELLEAAREDLQAVVAQDPQRARAWRFRGEVEYALNLFRTSLSSLTEARDKDTFLENASSISQQLGMIHFELHEDAQAHAECDSKYPDALDIRLATCRLTLAALAPPEAGLDSADVAQRIADVRSEMVSGDPQTLAIRFAPLEALAWFHVDGMERLQQDAWERYVRARDPRPNQYAACYLYAVGEIEAAMQEADAFLDENPDQKQRRVFDWYRAEMENQKAGGALAAR